MKGPITVILTALALASASAAALTPPAPAPATPAAPAAPAEPARPLDNRALERKLEEARARLERAAKEVAELSVGLVPDEETIRRMVGNHPHPVLGVQLGAQKGGGVPIAGVSPGGAAAEAGLLAGDVIISVNGRKVETGTDVAAEIHRLGPGAEARIERLRAGKVATLVVVPRSMDPRLTVLLGDMGQGLAELGDSVTQAFDHAMPWSGSGWGELELAEMSPGLGRYFGTDHGVLVLRAPSSFGESLKDGDVIVSIGGREPEGVSHALRILRSYQPLEHVPLALERDRKPLKTDLTMPERLHPSHPPKAPRAPRAPAAPAMPAAPAGPAAAPGAPPAPPASPANGDDTT